MKREIKIFKSFEEQEKYNLEQMRNTTPLERFKNLYRMQKLSQKFNAVTDKSRKIVIQNGRPSR